MKFNVVVATHHKTGTVWMDGVFKAIARDLGARFLDVWSEPIPFEQLAGGRFVLFCHDSQLREQGHLLDREDVRVLHVIRDPRDVVISATHYHKASRESWLHEPIPGYDNLTYQQSLRRLPTLHAQYVFEMEHSSASTLREMANWRYGRANCFEARYEDLRRDSRLAYWRRLTTFLGFTAVEQEVANEHFWQNSLFGGLSRLGNKHIRSGAVAQWREEFTSELGQEFLERFPDILEALSYESGNTWVRELPIRSASPRIASLRYATRSLLAPAYGIRRG